MKRTLNVGVIGGSACSTSIKKIAFRTGLLIAQRGWTLVCGGGGGVMEAACKGAREAGGITVGILPGMKRDEANEYVSVAVPTGIGYVRNFLVVRASDYLIAIDGKYGTLSEIAFALNEGKQIAGLDTWDIPGVVNAATPEAAVKTIERWHDKT